MFEKILVAILIASLLISLGLYCYFEFKKYNKNNYDNCEV